MPLPGSRDYDAVDAGPLPHATVNAIQDCIVEGKHGDIWEQWPARTDFEASGTTLNLMRFLLVGNSDSANSAIRGQTRGRRLKEWSATGILSAGSGDTWTAKLMKQVGTGAATQVGSTQTSASNTSEQTIGEVLGTPETIAAGTVYFLQVQLSHGGGAGTASIASFAARYDKP